MGRGEKTREERIVRALRQPPEELEVRGARRWRGVDEQWKSWLRGSATALELYTRRQEADEYRHLLGDDAYRDQLIEVLSRAVPRDCAAAGFGCAQRIDRPCRQPAVCARDRPCHAYYLEHGTGHVWIDFSPAGRHRAVLWWDRANAGRLWVDGQPVGDGIVLDSVGRWVDDRFYTVQAAGPDDHPAQEWEMGGLGRRIRSLLLYDAGHASARLLVPAAGESWTDPWVSRDGGSLRVHADGDDAIGRTP
ncbi:MULTISPECIES: hypothetical protein [unclassified Actinoplanes]|uniref:hypothetical protein n=1 Tax=unclassified Actinoplanes TaxID=2626549 RepID=UPI00030DF0B4|nr:MULTISPECIES: hypothetical protein [unclassified Actinoplanes]